MGSPTDDYTGHLVDLLASIGPCKAQRMFGGHGIAREGMNVALVIEGQAYLKVDAETRPRFEAAGGQPFTFQKQGKRIEVNYFTPPEDAFDSPSAMKPWAKLALEAAQRAAANKKPKKPKRKVAPRPRSIGIPTRARRSK